MLDFQVSDHVIANSFDVSEEEMHAIEAQADYPSEPASVNELPFITPSFEQSPIISAWQNLLLMYTLNATIQETMALIAFVGRLNDVERLQWFNYLSLNPKHIEKRKEAPVVSMPSKAAAPAPSPQFQDGKKGKRKGKRARMR